MRANEAVRRALGANGIKHWELAEALGMREETLSKKLRVELKDEDREFYLSVIEKITNERG